MDMTTLPPPPRQTANPSPARPASSVRRTCSIDVSWPDGADGDRRFQGRARDYRTSADGVTGQTIAEAVMEATLRDDKTIAAIAAHPTPAQLQKLVGERGGGHLRMIISDIMPELLEAGAPLYLILDDISGTSLVSSIAWSQWDKDWSKHLRDAIPEDKFEEMMTTRVNVCWGLKEGNSGTTQGGQNSLGSLAKAGELRNPADPEGWHEFPDQENGPGFRRARRIDVTHDYTAGLIRIDSAFQDSARKPDGSRVAIHEYRLKAVVHPTSLELLSLEPEARILPFSECPGAIHNTQRLIGIDINTIRESVLAELRGPQGCTHLNDAMRALAEVPKLMKNLTEDA